MDTSKPAVINEEKKLLPSDALKFSFTITYILLITTGTITIIEALRNKDPLVRHVLNLETAVSIIAGYFYSNFVAKVSSKEYEINWKDIMTTRYTDWFITTPIMLLALILALTQKLGTKPDFSVYVAVFVLNFLMLMLGYMGETGRISRNLGLYGGFLPFLVMYGIIFFQFVYGKGSAFNYVLFGLNFVVWSMYGIIYNMEDKKKNIIYNGLDLTAKCFIGVGLWVYFTGIFN
jgi:bacteriorhodopsin